MAAPTRPPVERTNPFPGARAFERGESHNFFGRERELANLVALVSAKRLVILHAPSGAGKSSLVNASLLAHLAADADRTRRPPPGKFDLLGVANVHPGAVRDDSGWPNAAKVPNVYVTAALNSIGEGKRSRHTTFASYLASRERRRDEFDDPVPMLLVFDQFEEILEPYGREDWFRCRDDVFTQLAAALRNDPLLHVLLVFREDHLASIERLARPIPARLLVRYRLDKLTVGQARTAIEKPARQSGLPIQEEALDSLLEELSKQHLRDIEEAIPSEFVDPGQLSVVCKQLWRLADRDARNQAAGERPGIDVEHLKELGGVAGTLQKYYDDAIEKESSGATQLRLRDLFEKRLIGDRGTRQLLPFDEESKETKGVPNAILKRLEDDYGLIRTERRGDTTYIELSHDGFVQPIRHANLQVRERRRRTMTRWIGVFVAALVVVLAVVLVAARNPRLDGAIDGPPVGFRLDGFQPQQVEFSGDAGQIVTLRATAAEADEGMDLSVDLYDEGGNTLATGTLTGSVALVPAVRLPITGTVAAVVTNRSGVSGRVDLSIEQLDVVSTRRIRLGQRVEGTIEKGDVVRLQFRGAEGTVLAANVAPSVEAAETFVQLLDPAGRMPSTSDHPAEGGTGIPRVVLRQTGDYMILVSGSGPYALTVVELEARDLDDGPLKATLAPGEVQNATLSGEQGQPIAVTLRPNDDSVRVELELRDPNDMLIASNFAPAGEELQLVSVLPETGRYHVVVWGIAAGSYTLQVEDPEITAVSHADNTIVGDAMTGSRIYEVPTDVGDVVQIKLQHVTAAVDVQAVASDGTPLDQISAVPESSDVMDSIVVVGSASDRTLLLVQGSGTYELAVSRPQAIQIETDTTVPGRIAIAGDVVAYRLAAIAGQRLTLETTTADSDLDTVLQIWGPDGTLLDENDDAADSRDSAIADVRVPTTGDHLIVVSGWQNTVGTYELTVSTL